MGAINLAPGAINTAPGRSFLKSKGNDGRFNHTSSVVQDRSKANVGQNGQTWNAINTRTLRRKDMRRYPQWSATNTPARPLCLGAHGLREKRHLGKAWIAEHSQRICDLY